MAFGLVNIGGVAFALDRTLSLEGTAADAKAVGDELAKKLDKNGGEMSGQITARNVPGFSDFTAVSDSIGIDAGFMAQNTQTNMAASFGVASNGALAGIYDHIGQQWMMCRPAGTKDIYINGDRILANSSPVITANGVVPMVSNLNFGKSYGGPYWQCENGSEYIVRPLSDGRFELARRNLAAGQDWTSVFTVWADGSMRLIGGIELTNAIDFGQRTAGIRWNLANGDIYEVRPSVGNNLFQIVRVPTDGTPAYGVMNVSENGIINFCCHRDKTVKEMGSIQEDGFHGNFHGTADSAKSAENGVTASGGGYIRLGNGTQICWGTIGPIPQISKYTTTKISVTYEAPFSSDEYTVTASALLDSGYTYGLRLNGVTRTATGATFGFSNSENATIPGGYYNYIAVGRWK